MSRNTSKIKFYARESKKDKDGLVHIEMSININQKRVFINLPMQVEPQKFNSKRRPKEYEDYIAQMRTRINEILNDMLLHGEPITAERIREYVRTGGYKSYTVEDMFNDYLNIIKNRGMGVGVYRKYELVKELYLEDNDGSKEVTAVTPQTVSAFQAKLADRYESSTAAGYMTKLKTFVKFAIDSGKLTVNPFISIKITREQKEIEYLTEEELAILEAQELENKSLQNVLDLFLFQASSGLAYADIVALQKDDIKTDDNGNMYIHKKRVKTGTEYTAVIFPTGQKILEKYDYNLKVISNQKMNAYLHIIERMIGFKKSLHSHLARHTYLTTLLNRGVRLETVSHAGGHKSVKITEKFYAHLHDQTIINELATAVRR